MATPLAVRFAPLAIPLLVLAARPVLAVEVEVECAVPPRLEILNDAIENLVEERDLDRASFVACEVGAWRHLAGKDPALSGAWSESFSERDWNFVETVALAPEPETAGLLAALLALCAVAAVPRRAPARDSTRGPIRERSRLGGRDRTMREHL